ncbi:tetratricopeptide repeat protein [Streptomyces beihaiensis]|uniref:Helix-turn-helix domain-containing protein n=1 Tax=Streptomyces beihaiensis TaxID=2984495 RepID=A0ABT3TMP9_9ACTN|nr:tetratricopeptide repeat protein [Streptomyces beihaiensis]MCX3058329.1 helix-turn-helix domain-containing protein [Streptomyces beihaiensis]
MTKRGWSQSDLARESNVPVSTLSGILNGRSAGHSSNFTMILDALFPGTKTVAAVGRLRGKQEAEVQRRQSEARQALTGLWDEATRRISPNGGRSGRSSARSRGPVEPPAPGPEGTGAGARGDSAPHVDQFTRRALLGIHEAIPLPADADSDADLAVDLPLYVARDVDTQLRAALTGFKTTGGFALLLGGPAAGKTRTAHEALLAVVPDWTFVVPADGASVETLAADFPADGGSAGIVLWLDELQSFLAGPVPLAAATVRSLLAEAAPPVIIVGTMWPDVYERLRAVGAGRGSGDRGEGPAGSLPEEIRASARNAREVLAMAQRFDLAAFRPGEWERAAAVAAADPRIAHALRHKGDFSLPQVLAGVPELLHRWNTADQPYGKAILTAAVTARRAGHRLAVPGGFLEAVAPSFLNGRQRAAAGAAWFDDALAWACEPVFPHTEIALLSPCGQTMGRVDGYRVSDVLARHLDINWLTVPPDVWPVMVAAADPEARRQIGYNAMKAGYPDVARAAFQDEADRGDLNAMFDLGLLASSEGDPDEARHMLTSVAESGYPLAMYNLAGVLHGQGDLDGARHWYRRAAEAGTVFAMIKLGELLYALGEREEGLAWVRRAVDYGGQAAMTSYAQLLRAEGLIAAARHWLVRAAEEQYSPARQLLAAQLYEDGDVAGARRWLTVAAEDTAGSNVHRTSAMHALGEMYRHLGDLDRARGWWERAADLPPFRRGKVNPAGVVSMYALGLLAHQQEDVSTARRWFCRAAEAGSTDAVYALGVMAHAEGDTVAAGRFWRRAAESGQVDAMLRLGWQAARQGDVPDCAHWLSQAAEKGSGIAEMALGVLFSETDPTAARHWLARAAERGIPRAVGLLAKALEQTGDAADAEEARRWRAGRPSDDGPSDDGPFEDVCAEDGPPGGRGPQSA